MNEKMHELFDLLDRTHLVDVGQEKFDVKIRVIRSFKREIIFQLSVEESEEGHVVLGDSGLTPEEAAVKIMKSAEKDLRAWNYEIKEPE